MQTGGSDTADVHSRPFTDRLETPQNRNVFRSAVRGCHVYNFGSGPGRKMPRALLLCTTIVAAFQLRLAAASPNVEDAPVTPGVSAIAVRLGIEAARHPADFLSQITRLLNTRPDSRRGSD